MASEAFLTTEPARPRLLTQRATAQTCRFHSRALGCREGAATGARRPGFLTQDEGAEEVSDMSNLTSRPYRRPKSLAPWLHHRPRLYNNGLLLYPGIELKHRTELRNLKF